MAAHWTRAMRRSLGALILGGVADLLLLFAFPHFFSAWFDRTFVDGAVNGVGAVTQVFGSAVRLLQSGRVQQYAAFAVAGGLAAAVWLILL